MTQATVRILHLSDVHFGRDHYFQKTADASVPRSLAGSLADVLVPYVKRRGELPDALVVSGDHTSTGTKAEFLDAHQFLKRLLDEFDLGPERLLVVPGNHDVLWGREKGVVSSAEYESFTSRIYGTPVQDLEMRSVRLGEVFLLGLDLTRIETPERGGIGFVGKDQLEKAEECLEKEGADTKVRFLVIHHHLLPVAWQERLPDEYPQSLTLDAPLLLGWAQEHGFSAILHGHQHQSFVSMFQFADRPNGPFIVSGAPSAASKSLPAQGRNGFQSVMVDGHRLSLSVHLLTEANEFQEDKTVDFVREITGVFTTHSIPSARLSQEPTLTQVRTHCKLALEHADAVTTQCYGPKGGFRGAVTSGGVQQVRDGQRIIASLRSGDSLETRFVESLATLAQQMSKSYGDGRKSAMLICSKTVKNALKNIEDGAAEVALCHGIENAAAIAAGFVNETSKPITTSDEVKRIAMTAANGHQKIGELITTALHRAGKDGIVEVQRHPIRDDLDDFEILVKDGFRIPCRLPAWLEEMVATDNVLRNPMLLVSTSDVNSREIVPVLEFAVRQSRPMVILCDSLDDTSSDIVAKNYRDGIVKCVALPAKSSETRWYETFSDLAALTGAKLIEAGSRLTESGLRESDFGAAESVRFDNDEMAVIGGHGESEEIRKRVEMLRRHIDEEDSDYDRERLQERLTNIRGTRVIVKVRGHSIADGVMLESLTIDALHSSRKGIETGIVPGGGATYLRAARHIESTCELHGDMRLGAMAFAAGLRAPLHCLVDADIVDADTIRDTLLSDSQLTFDLGMNSCVHWRTSGPIDAAGTVAGVISHAAETAIRLVKTRSWEIGASSREDADG